jgi:hypothetical protein
MIFDTLPPERSRERKAITDHYLADETACLEALIAAAQRGYVLVKKVFAFR